MFGRNIDTQLPSKDHSVEFEKKSKENRQKSVEKYYNKTATDLSKLKPNQSVCWKNGRTERKYKHGRVVSQNGERSYIIQGENGGQYIRNRVDLRPSAVPVYNNPDPDPRNRVCAPLSLPEVHPDIENTPDKENKTLVEAPKPAPAEPRPQRIRERPKHFTDYETPWSN